jgi:hypothetical protein
VRLAIMAGPFQRYGGAQAPVPFHVRLRLSVQTAVRDCRIRPAIP